MHSCFCLYIRSSLPDLVAFPKSTEEVSTIAKLCNEHRIPLIPFGTGTGLEGGINAGIVCISSEFFIVSLKQVMLFFGL